MLTGLSSGMGANELSKLTVRMFREGYDPKTEVTTIDMRRGKVGFDFITFLSPEASRAVWDYLDYRDRPTKTGRVITVEQQEKQRTTDDSYLFIVEKVPGEYLENRNEELRGLTAVGIGKMYQRISNRAGKDTVTGQYNTIRSHNMRKIFNSTLKNAGCDSDLVEYFMGHTLGGTKGAYYRPDVGKLKEIYIRFVPHLLISEEFELKEELKKKDEEQNKLQDDINDIKLKYDALHRQVAAMELANRVESEKEV
jgi:integrase